MEILQIVGFGIIAAILAVTIKQEKPEMAIYISITAGLFILFIILGKLPPVIRVMENMMNKVQLGDIHLSTLLKIIGIAYITEFGVQICKDTGEGAIASKIEIGGKILIMVMSLPILIALMEIILKILP